MSQMLYPVLCYQQDIISILLWIGIMIFVVHVMWVCWNFHPNKDYVVWKCFVMQHRPENFAEDTCRSVWVLICVCFPVHSI